MSPYGYILAARCVNKGSPCRAPHVADAGVLTAAQHRNVKFEGSFAPELFIPRAREQSS